MIVGHTCCTYVQYIHIESDKTERTESQREARGTAWKKIATKNFLVVHDYIRKLLVLEVRM